MSTQYGSHTSKPHEIVSYTCSWGKATKRRSQQAHYHRPRRWVIEFYLTNRLADRVLDHLLHHYSENVLTHALREQLAQKTLIIQTDTEIIVSEAASPEQYQQLKREIITIRREELTRLRDQNLFSEALIRQKEFELDLEQMALS